MWKSPYARVAAAIVCASVAAAAHDLYLLPAQFFVQPGATLQVEVHNGDAFPESENAPHPERLRDTFLYGRNGAPSPIINLQMKEKATVGKVRVPSAPGDLQLAVHTVPNHIVLAPVQFESYLREEGLASVLAYRAAHGEQAKPGSERYTKFAKSLLRSGAPDDFYKHPLGLLIEFIPLKDPSLLHAGDRLPVRLLYSGKPASGLQVEAAWSGKDGRKAVSPVGSTDASGLITVPLTDSGRWRLHSIRMVRCEEPAAADWESSWASLTFEVR